MVTGNYRAHATAWTDSDVARNKIVVYDLYYDSRRSSLLGKAIKYLMLQFRLAVNALLALDRDTDVTLVYSATTLIVPVIVLKLARRRVILSIMGFHSTSARFAINRHVSKLLHVIESIVFMFSDVLVVESALVMSDPKLRRFKHKTFELPPFVDLDFFSPRQLPSTRHNVVGYIGRLSREKGVLDFLEAIPVLLGKFDDVSFLIIGNGPLFNEVENVARNCSRVSFPGWMNPTRLPACLNDLKLLVLPSYTEGLPNVLLEALACKTPVLATAVGGIPSVIKDGITGFILPDNEPAVIVEHVSKCLFYSDTNEIAERAYELVRQEYGYSKVVKRYKWIFERFADKRAQ